jgi:hypothetical protein
MEKPSKKRGFRMVFLVAVVLLVILFLYAILTFPNTVVDFPVSFTFGANMENREFDMSPLHNWVQIEVIVSSGTALWTATIEDQGETIWSHRASQGDQTIYTSGWIELSSGNYNFTFATAGFGELDADVKVTTKGGFW